LVGTIIIIAGALVIIALRIEAIVPGLNMLFLGIGLLVISIALLYKPDLYYILPFKVFRLVVINTENGVPLFTKIWDAKTDLVNDSLFSAMISGICMFLNEAVKRGDLEEMRLSEAIMIVKKIENHPTACVLIANKPSKLLREALDAFAFKFTQKFGNDLEDVHETSKFEAASELASECFTFIPRYE
jgi:hypothetical protein